MQPIPLASLLPGDFDPGTCKLHCAVYNGKNYPIDVLANDPEEWQRWNSWRGPKDDFNRQFVFSLAQDRYDPTLWLFGGIWEVVGRRPEPRTYSYEVVLREDLMGPFIRRLYVRMKLAGRQRRRTMESCLDEMTVSSILEEPFVGEPFPGHDRINHTLADLQRDRSLAGRADHGPLVTVPCRRFVSLSRGSTPPPTRPTPSVLSSATSVATWSVDAGWNTRQAWRWTSTLGTQLWSREKS